MKKIMPWMAALMALAIGSTAHAAEEKIAHLDLARILQTYQKGDPATARFREEVERKRKEFDLQKAAITEMRKKLEAQEAMLSEEERVEQKRELAEKATDLMKVLSETQQDMKTKEEFINAALVEKVRSVIQEFGVENGYRYIVDGGQPAVLFADDSLNVTEAVLKKLEEDR